MQLKKLKMVGSCNPNSNQTTNIPSTMNQFILIAFFVAILFIQLEAIQLPDTRNAEQNRREFERKQNQKRAKQARKANQKRRK